MKCRFAPDTCSILGPRPARPWFGESRCGGCHAGCWTCDKAIWVFCALKYWIGCLFVGWHLYMYLGQVMCYVVCLQAIVDKRKFYLRKFFIETWFKLQHYASNRWRNCWKVRRIVPLFSMRTAQWEQLKRTAQWEQFNQNSSMRTAGEVCQGPSRWWMVRGMSSLVYTILFLFHTLSFICFVLFLSG